MPRGKTKRLKGKFSQVIANKAEAKTKGETDLSGVCSLRHVSIENSGSEVKLVKTLDTGLFSSDSRNQYEFPEVENRYNYLGEKELSKDCLLYTSDAADE